MRAGVGRLRDRWLAGTLREGQAITAATVAAGLVASAVTGLLLHRAQFTAEEAAWRQAEAKLGLFGLRPAARPALRLVASAGRRLDGVS